LGSREAAGRIANDAISLLPSQTNLLGDNMDDDIVTNGFAASNGPRLSFALRNNADWSQSFWSRGVDLSGAALRMELRPDGGGPVIFELSTSNNRLQITDPASGRFSINVPAADMASIPAGLYQADVLLFDYIGNIRTVFVCSAAVEAGQTVPQQDLPKVQIKEQRRTGRHHP
jgi:hypothetical protein